MEVEWDTEVLCALKGDELALMVLVGGHTNYENDLIIDLGCSNHMIDK